MLLHVRFEQKPCETRSQLAFSPSPSLVLSGISMPSGIKYFKIFHFVGYIHSFLYKKCSVAFFYLFLMNTRNKVYST